MLVSGRGSNLQALLDDDTVRPALVAVVSNVAGAPALERARRAGVPTLTVAHRDYPARGAFEDALGTALDALAVDLVVLAGFMRVLTPRFVARYANRIINIHPSLLPAFPGLDTHQRALEAGARWHGATVHVVTEALDAGPLLAQARVPVGPRDNADALAARVLQAEHKLLPNVVRWCLNGRLVLDARLPELDGEPLHVPRTLTLDKD